MTSNPAQEYLLSFDGAGANATAWRVRSGAELTIGRHEDCDIVIRDNAISLNHATVSFKGDGVNVHDNRSSNGTFLGGERITTAAWPEDAVLKLGGTGLTWTLNTPANQRKLRQATLETDDIQALIAWKVDGENSDPGSERAVRAGDQLVVGRGASCDIVLPDPAVSRTQAKLDIRTGRVLVRNLSKSNPTKIDDVALDEGELTLGARLRMANSEVRIRLQVGRGADVRGAATSPQDDGPRTQPPQPIYSTPAALRILWQPKLAEDDEKPKSMALVAGAPLLVGKDRSCHIVIDDPLVSRKHARISLTPHGVEVVDLGSTNGSSIAGQQIQRAGWPLEQQLEIGGHVFALSTSANDTIATGRGARQLRVFISYSRRDMAIADRMSEALKQVGFAVTIDREDLPFGEEFMPQLAAFVRAADTVLFLASKHSSRSQWCDWELDQVKEANKRLFPVVIDDVTHDQLPKQITRVHLLPPKGVFDFRKHFGPLVEFLSKDQAWIKEHTRLSELARVWIDRGRPSAMLLYGSALRDAENFIKRKPNSESIAEEVFEFVKRSRRSQWHRRVGFTGFAGVGIVGVMAAIFFILSLLAFIDYLQGKNSVLQALFRDKEKELEQKVADLTWRNSELWKILERQKKYQSRFLQLLRKELGPSRGGIEQCGDRFCLQSRILFASGRASINDDGQVLLGKIANVINSLDNEMKELDLDWIVQIEGHTDKRRIRTARFESNLDLSIARAREVFRFLADKGNVPEARLVPAGYGSTRPRSGYEDDSEESLQRNRRIEFKLTYRPKN